VRMVAVFLAIWAAAIGLLAWAFGAQSDLTHMARFFTQAALVTFGGAYAVLPYVLQAAVETYGWVTATQMIDGLALGETTPGPLIMVVAFVGFVGAWTQEVFGSGALLTAGVMGASVATFFTFLPSFLFILAGAPLVEHTRDDTKLTAPLTAITAAVVGVIVNLAIYFAWRVFWPASTASAPFAGAFDAASLAIAIIATAALVTKKAEVIPVIAASGLAGLALWALGYSAT
jgi:chromate transporter